MTPNSIDCLPKPWRLLSPDGISPGTILTFQVHPQAQGSGLETEILAWATGQMRAGAQARGKPLSLWCRCHESETERRTLLEQAGFSPLPAEDLRLLRSLDAPPPATSLPSGFFLHRRSEER